MPDYWTIITIAVTVAYATCWQRRHTWRSRNYSLSTRSLFIHATGLLLISPMGEPVGHLAEPWVYNLEDTSGHLCLLWAAAATVINAGRILRAPAITRITISASTAASTTIVAVAYWSGTYSHPSAPGNPHDTAYWAIMPLLLLPAYAFASWTNLHVFAAATGSVRRIAGVQGAALAAGVAGCLCRIHPSVPNAWMYWCYAACLVGSAIAQWAVWRPYRRHMRDIRGLHVVGETRGENEENPT